MGKQPPPGGSEAATDLFDRWLAHHEQTATPAAASEETDEEAPAGPVATESVTAAEAEPEPVAETPEPTPAPTPRVRAKAKSARRAAEPTLWEPAAEEQLSLADVEARGAEKAPPAPSAPLSAAEEDPWTLGSFDDDPLFAPQPPADPEPEDYESGNAVDAGRAIFAALMAPEPPIARPVAVPDVPVEAKPSRAAARKPAARSAAPALLAPVPPVVEFAPRTAARRIVGLLVLVGLAATGVAGYLAWQERTFGTIGIAATLGVLTAVIWAVRAGSAVATLTVRGGQLEVLRGGSRHRFDLSSHYTPLEIISEPGRREWKVLFHRRGIAPFVIDSSMVDPAEFMRVLNHYRPVD